MTLLRGIVKSAFFLVVVCAFLSSAFVAQLFVHDQKKRRHLFSYMIHKICKFGIWFLNVNLVVKNPPPMDTNYLCVGNHLGMLDIVVLAAIRPTLFITSVEMRETPGLGLLCEMGGCIFVERRSRSGIHGEIGQIRTALQQGMNVALYPEGTSTNGEKVLPFKKSLLTSAAGTGVHILPMVVNYRMVNGEPMSDKVRDIVCWYGDQPFQDSFWRLITMKSCLAEIEFLQEIQVHSEEQRREVAANAQAQIEAKYAPIPKL